MSRSEQPRIAVVLSGGGARGAYEAGVLYYVLERLPHVLGRPVHLDILSGSSVGAIHACFVAGHAGDPGALERLLAIWRAFDVDSVYDVRARAVVGFALGLLGFRSRAHPVAGDVPQAPTRIPGLLDASPLERLILNEIPWQRIPEKLAGGALDTLAIAATEVKSGRTIVFVENREGRVDRWAHDPFIVARPERIGPEHALASAAIPLFFPTIRIGGSYYCDGSLRLNTPLAPALRLGADRVLVIGVHHV
ncbi:MAG: hypothetical protein QOD06_3247, partial [Candidatus Binatota bacterium]|nr:hypothetical protein [Candidatus Binatota bacterium]